MHTWTMKMNENDLIPHRNQSSFSQLHDFDPVSVLGVSRIKRLQHLLQLLFSLGLPQFESQQFTP